MNDIDPKISVSRAVNFAGSQAALARLLQLSKASVNEWVADEREFVPPLQAYRLRELHPEIVSDGV
jgi:DNA-binding transcriptional regulator YdaS (Cro superfamily)